MKKIPISLIIDDFTPVMSLSYYGETRILPDGREKTPRFSYSALVDFCDVIEKTGIKGKFSIVPMPAGRGNIVDGITDVEQSDLALWLDTVRARIVPRFTVCPEMITHGKAADLAGGGLLNIREDDWSQQQSRETLTPYITRALELVRDAGFSVNGVTSPWEFGIDVEEDYIRAISDAVFAVSGSDKAWYFLHCIRDKAGIRPWVALDSGDRTVVTIPATTHDHIWRTLECDDTSEEFISSVADGYITADGKGGEIPTIIENGGYPILLTHWQCLMSNGSSAGIRALELVGERVRTHLSDVVKWMDIHEIMDMVLEDKDYFTSPI